MNDEPFLDDVLNDSAPNASLIIFYGPPCSGKTRYYLQNFKDTHIRVSLTEQKNKSLRSILKHVVSLLNTGMNVCIDDRNSKECTRQSIIKAVRAGAPTAIIKAIIFSPSGGITQCKHAAEWASALWHTEPRTVIPDDLIGDAEYIPPTPFEFQEFENHAQPLEAGREGFDQVQIVSQGLYSYTSPFHRPGLFIEFTAIGHFRHVKEEDYIISLRENVREVIEEWQDQNPEGRVLILIDEAATFPATIELHHDDPEMQTNLVLKYRKQIQNAIGELRLKNKVYTLHAAYGAVEQDHYFRQYYSGMIAWLQYKHRIKLEESVFVVECARESVKKSPFNLTYINATDFFDKSGWNVDAKIRRYGKSSTTTAEFLNNIEYLGVHQENQGLDEKHTQVQPSSEWHFVEETAGLGCIHCCCFPGRTNRTSEPNTATNSQNSRAARRLPQWMSEPPSSRLPPRLPTYTDAPTDITNASVSIRISRKAHRHPAPIEVINTKDNAKKDGKQQIPLDEIVDDSLSFSSSPIRTTDVSSSGFTPSMPPQLFESDNEEDASQQSDRLSRKKRVPTGEFEDKCTYQTQSSAPDELDQSESWITVKRAKPTPSIPEPACIAEEDNSLFSSDDENVYQSQ